MGKVGGGFFFVWRGGKKSVKIVADLDIYKRLKIHSEVMLFTKALQLPITHVNSHKAAVV